MIKLYKRPIIIPLLIFIVIILLVDTFLPTVFLRNHYTKHLSETTTFKYLIIDSPRQTPKTYSYIAQVIEYKDTINTEIKKTNGRIKIFISKKNKIGSANKILQYGDVIICSDNLQRIRNLDSITTFNYAKYMRHKRIYHQVFIKDFELVATNQGNPILRYAKRTNLWLQDRLQRTNMGVKQKQIATALLLGDKRDMDKEIKQQFNTSGLAHILCVSGLHIMMIVFAFSYLLKRILPTSLIWIYIRNVAMLLLCWAMAFIVGLTPSALRVATMLSLLIISKFTFLNDDRLNILLFTAFLFLCFDPLLLFNISFQLSFLAVMGLITIKPWLYNFLWNRTKFKNRVLSKLLSNISTTTSAQVFTFPIILVNFGRFPIFFLITNLIVIPFMQIVLVSLILLLFVADVPLLNTAVTYICNLEMSALIEIVSFVDNMTAKIF